MKGVGGRLVGGLKTTAPPCRRIREVHQLHGGVGASEAPGGGGPKKLGGSGPPKPDLSDLSGSNLDP